MWLVYNMANEIEATSDSDPDDEKLDTDWLEDFKDEENLYNKFYKEPNTSIRLYLLYIKNKELIQVETRPACPLAANGLLPKEHIMALIKEYQNWSGETYKLTALLRYNIDLSPDDITDFLQDTKAPAQFLTPEKYLEDIHYHDSIPFFQDLNALYFIYTADAVTGSLNQTKRITFVKNTHKTKRNKLKANKRK